MSSYESIDAGRAERSVWPPLRGAAWLEWVVLVGYMAGLAVAVSLALAALVLVVSASAHAAAKSPAPAQDGPSRPRLLFQTHHGLVEAPLQATEVALQVTGVTVRARVRQRFMNPGGDWLEGVYLFPLPDDSAVDGLRMRIGDRALEGVVRPRAQAQREHDAARTQGRASTLLEQQRPNVFSVRVANVAPRSAIVVELDYQQALALRDGHWRLRFPTVVAPRYDPAPDAQLRAPAHPDDPPRALALPVALPFDGTRALPANAPAPRIFSDPDLGVHAPVLAAGETPLNPLRLDIELDAGVPITPPTSATHRVVAQPLSDGGYRVSLADVEVADRDFELEWAPRAAEPQAALRIESRDGRHYGLLVLAPPAGAPARAGQPPRETTFVIDTSGSMAGTSIEQARRALLAGLARLNDGDRVNVIEFNSHHRALYPRPLPVDARRRAEVARFVDGLRASGGTEMRGALEQALSAPVSRGHLAQLVFITDGAVASEDELLSLIAERAGDRRLFAIGIGSAPNGWFLRKAAELGRGRFVDVPQDGAIEQRLGMLFDRLAQPALTELRVDFDGAQPLDPVRVPGELYAGEPVVLRLRFDEPPRSARLTARRGTERVELTAPAVAAPASGLNVLWARDRIEQLDDAIRAARALGAQPQRLVDELQQTALAHRLITRYTSMVALDVQAARASLDPLYGGPVPLNLPAGWSHEAVFADAVHAGELAQGATPAARQAIFGVLAIAFAAGLAFGARGRSAGGATREA